MELLNDEQIGDLLESSYFEQFEVKVDNDPVTTSGTTTANTTPHLLDKNFDLFNEFDIYYDDEPVSTSSSSFWPITSYIPEPIMATRANSVSSIMSMTTAATTTPTSATFRWHNHNHNQSQSQNHSRNHCRIQSLASPLQVPAELQLPSAMPPACATTVPSPVHNKIRPTQRSKSFDAYKSSGGDIYSYNFSSLAKAQHSKYKVHKSSSSSVSTTSNSSPIMMRAPLKPCVTIASIDTLDKFQKSMTINNGNAYNNNSSSNNNSINNSNSMPKKVGNPFYKPVTRAQKQPSSQPQLQPQLQPEPSINSTASVNSATPIEPDPISTMVIPNDPALSKTFQLEDCLVLESLFDS
ncbi:uncharacterized protein LODBEIA_P28040 [Lodderomyces beijingensis]|uniref:Uncharacterized protein n=1 Tax=Lodderomyces beijingensis TaxID=1775926 RepID=A0ABP0ZQU9_9ASCO